MEVLDVWSKFPKLSLTHDILNAQYNDWTTVFFGNFSLFFEMDWKHITIAEILKMIEEKSQISIDKWWMLLFGPKDEQFNV